VIKGINRRVIVVRAPDRRFFEEAIFIVREGVIGGKGVTAEQVLEEARRVAESYERREGRRWHRRFPAMGYVAVGALLATVLWCVGLVL